jgi:hypothetical protein
MTQFYTYAWLREKDESFPAGTPYYVGKGTGRRAYKHHGVNHRPRSKHMIIVQHWESEEKAFEMEKWWIAFWGRIVLGTGILRNFTDGGEGLSGSTRSEETKEKIRKSQAGRKHSKEWNEANSAAHMGQSPWNKGTKSGIRISEETRNNMSKAQRNRIKRNNCTSEFKGVRKTPSGKWQATLWVDGKIKNLGFFEKEKDAALMVEKSKGAAA